MKKAFLYVLVALSLASCEELLNGLKNNDGNIVAGLKEALRVGTDTAVFRLSRSGGYLADAAVKILIPEEAQTTFRAVKAIAAVPDVQAVMKVAGMDLTEGFENVLITAFNEAAEHAAPKATDIFVSAIRGMSIDDGKEILFSKNNDTAATSYLRKTTWVALTTAFAPVISTSMNSVRVGDYTATSAWEFFAEQNNKLASIAASDEVKLALIGASLFYGKEVAEINSTIKTIQPVSTDIGAYVTGKALNGLFTKVGDQEHKIRTDASARVNKLLQEVFGMLDN